MARTIKRDERELTFTERARRSQLIEVTIGLVAESGYAGTSLARIAEGAGITKAAVLYHYPTKDAVVRAAYEHVLTALITQVATAVEAVEPAQGPAAYIRTMIGYLRESPEHTRMIVEAMTSQPSTADGSGPGSQGEVRSSAQEGGQPNAQGESPVGTQDQDPSTRWRGLAAIMASARQAKGLPTGADLRTLAIMVGGAIDAIVGERLLDADYDTRAAAEDLVLMTERTLFA